MRVIGAILLLAAAGPALAAKADKSPEQKLAELTGGAAPGTPVSCIQQVPTMDSTTIDGVGIVYRQGRTLWVNHFASDCRIRWDDFVVTRTPGTQLCRGDIVTVVDRSTRTQENSCSLGDFIPYERPARK